jgi:asparagine synthetase B (glutamine-hydrolysing)
MNFLFGYGPPAQPAPWEAVLPDQLAGTAEEGFRLYGRRISCSTHDREPLHVSPHSGTTCAVIGYVSNVDDLIARHGLQCDSDAEMIALLYDRKGNGCFSELEGVFSVILSDVVRHRLFLFQDRFASNLPVYYHASGSFFVFSTSLKYLLRKMPGKRQLDTGSVYALLQTKSIVPNRKTLVQGVSKLTPGQCLEIDTQSKKTEIHRIGRKGLSISERRAEQEILDSAMDHVGTLCRHLRSDRVALALSGGYDSNLILYALRRHTHTPVVAITIGGKLRNEIPQSSSIVKEYDHVDHCTATVDIQTLDSLPAIVWRLEGYACEWGIFLQYLLAQQLGKNHCKVIFQGEGPDHLLDRKRQQHLTDWVARLLNFIRHPIFHKQRFLAEIRNLQLFQLLARRKFKAFLSEMVSRYAGEQASEYEDDGLDMILKKNGLICNSFGAQSLYPFLNERFLAIAGALQGRNHKKKLYIEKIAGRLPEAVVKHIYNAGGSTDTEYLFRNYTVDVIEALLESGFARKLFTPEELKRMLRDRALFFEKGDVRQEILVLLYVFVFESLFISGRYDEYFDQTEVGDSLLDLLSF